MSNRKMLTNGHLLIAIGVTIAAFFGAAAIPDQADAATPLPASNWLRPCKSTHKVHITASCTLSPPIQPHSLTYDDATGTAVTLHSGAAVWAFAKAHSRPCGTRLFVSCYGYDDVTRSKVIALPSGMYITLAFIR